MQKYFLMAGQNLSGGTKRIASVDTTAWTLPAACGTINGGATKTGAGKIEGQVARPAKEELTLSL